MNLTQLQCINLQILQHAQWRRSMRKHLTVNTACIAQSNNDTTQSEGDQGPYTVIPATGCHSLTTPGTSPASAYSHSFQHPQFAKSMNGLRS